MKFDSGSSFIYLIIQSTIYFYITYTDGKSIFFVLSENIFLRNCIILERKSLNINFIYH